MHKADIIAILSRVAGLGILATDATFTSALTTLFGPYGTKIIAVIGLVAIIATDIIRVQSVPTPSGDTTDVTTK
jgi:hypothetical protein